MRISKYRKKITVDNVVPKRIPEYDHRVCPRSVSDQSTLTHRGAEAPNIKSIGRKIQLRGLNARVMKRRMRSTSGNSGCLNSLARTYGPPVMPHPPRLSWLSWF